MTKSDKTDRNGTRIVLMFHAGVLSGGALMAAAIMLSERLV